MTLVHLRTHAGNYLCAEAGGGREVNATRSRAFEWETFDMVPVEGDPAQYSFRASNGQFVCAENGGGHTVVANRDQVLGWESFRVEGLGADGLVGGEAVHLRTGDGIHFVCAEDGGGREVNATRTEALGWETFQLELAGEQNPRLQMPEVTRNLGNGHWMQSNFTTAPGGSIRGYTRLTCTHKLVGFTGAVRLIFVDAQGRKLGDTALDPWGIGQAPIVGAAHREEYWFAEAPPGTHDIAMIQYWAPQNRITGIIAAVDDIVQAIVEVVTFVVEFCAKYPDVCEAVAAAFSSSDGGEQPED